MSRAPSSSSVVQRVALRPLLLFALALGTAGCPGYPKTAAMAHAPNLLPFPRTGDGHDTATDAAVGVVFWNYWAEPIPYLDYHEAPLDRIDPGDRFWLALDLSDVNYIFREFSAKGSQRFLDDLNAAAASDEPEAVYRLFVAPDQDFVGGNPYTAELRIDLAKVRRIVAAQAAHDLPKRIDALSEAAEVSFAHVMLPLTALRAGQGSVAVGIWDANWDRPLDELSIPIRVGSDRIFVLPVSSWFSGVDSLRVGKGAPRPDAALHVFQLGNGLEAVFRSKDARPGEFLSWRLDQVNEDAAPGLLDFLGRLSNDLANLTKDFAIWRLGTDLRDVLFKGVEQSPPFIAFTQARTPQTLYARVLQDANDPPVFLPLGILPLGQPPHVDFLGFHDRIETPLDRSWPDHPEGCISDWNVLLPKESLNDVQMNDVLSALRPNGQDGSFLRWAARRHPIATMEALKAVVRNEQPGLGPNRRTVLVIASHQSNDGLFHGNGDLSTVFVRDTDFKAKVGPGSVALLLGCETAGPAAAKIVRALNANGVAAVIATQTKVTGSMIGELLDALSDSIGNQPTTIGDAFAAATKKLRPSLGARALDFVLLGDPSVRLCRPQ